MVDPNHTHQAVFEFQLDAAGRRLDGLYDVQSEQSPNGLDWNSGWQSAVKLQESGWQAELAIPWHNLGVTPLKGTTMGLQIWRSGKGMKSNHWSYMPRWWGVQSPP